MNQQNKKTEGTQAGSQFESGFGGSMFGGGGGTQPNGSQFGGGNNSQFTQGGGAPGGGGEFSSGFGGTNAVSQIFKDGGFGGDDKKKRMIIMGAFVAALVVCFGAVWFLFFRTADEAETAGETPALTPTVAAAPADASAGAATDAEVAEDEEMGEDGAEDDVAAADSAASTQTAGSSSWAYDEETGGPIVSAAPGATIEVARTQSFADRYVAGRANASGKFRIPAPPPGKVYWREAGSAAINEISISAPARLGLSFQAPATVETGGSLSWQASGPASFYRVEFATDANFQNMATVIATSQAQAAIKDVSAGKYFVRVGGFNRAAGKWEWSSASSVEVR